MKIFELLGKIIVDNAEANKQIDETTDKAKNSQSKISSTMEKVGKTAGKVAKFAGKASVVAGTVITAIEGTRAYRTEMGKLETAFETAGFSTDSANKTFTELNSILGETDQAVEASNHLAKLCDTEQELEMWTNICTGVYATFGASLPIEGLTESANETAKVGTVTGSLADALNWAGVSEDEFNQKLAACNSEQERQALITDTLNGLYDDASKKYKQNNKDVIEANKAQQKLTGSMAKVGAVLEPVLTTLKNVGAVLLTLLASLLEPIGALVGILLPPIVTLISAIAGGITSFVKPILEWLTGFLSGALSEALKFVMPIIQAVGDAFVGVWQLISEAWSVAGEFFGGLWQGIQSIFAPVAEFFSTVFGNGIQGVMDAVSPIIDFFSGVWQSISDIFVKIGVVIGDAIVGSVVEAINFILSTAVGIINGFISAINVAIGVINAIPGVSIDKLDKLDVPQLEQGGILEKGQVGLLEGNGAEAVVPLDQNKKWISKVADDMEDAVGSKSFDRLIELILQIIKMLQGMGDKDIVLYNYIGTDLLEEKIISANASNALRTGGMA